MKRDIHSPIISNHRHSTLITTAQQKKICINSAVNPATASLTILNFVVPTKKSLLLVSILLECDQVKERLQKDLS